MSERHRARGCPAQRRLRVLPAGRPRRRVPGVTDRDVPVQRIQRRFVEDLRDQAHVLVDEDLATIRGRDPCRLLPAMLERVEAEVGQLGDLLAGRPHPENSAGILWALLRWENVVT